MLQIASLGSCLSSLTAVHLVSDYGCSRINNLIISRSDHFRSVFIDKDEALPPLAVVEELLGVYPDQDEKKIHWYLYENYPATAGISDFPPGTPSILHNLMFNRFDLLVLDNLGDATQPGILCKNPAFPPFKIVFPVLLAPKAEAFWSHCELLPFLSPRASAENWTTIVRFLHVLQPKARLVFVCAPSCTVRDMPERYHLANAFFTEFSKLAADLPIDIIAPTEVPASLTMLPNDREHFDMKVYRAIAGHIFLSTVGRWPKGTYGHLTAPTVVPTMPTDEHSDEATPVDAVAPADGAVAAQEAADASQTISHTGERSPMAATAADGPVGVPKIGPRVGSYGRSAAAATIVPSPSSLTQVLAAFLSVDPEGLTEQSGQYTVDNWDSLTQLNIIANVEKVFGVKFAFDDIINAGTVGKIREALQHLGVAPCDTKETVANLFAGFAARALARPSDRYALFVKGGVEREITNGWIIAWAAGVAAALRDLPRGAIVVIVLDHSEHQYSTFIGCVLSGLVPTFLPPLTVKQDPALFRASMATLFERIRPAAVVTNEAVAASIPVTTAPVFMVELLVVPEWADAVAAVERLIADPSPAGLAFLQHSSGTTGLKKGVMLSHAQVSKQIEIYSERIKLEPGNVVVSWLPLYHDMGLLTSFIMPTVRFCPIISMDAIEWVTRPLLLLVYLEQAHYAWLPNFAFHHIVRSDDGARTWAFHDVKAVTNCSEACRSASFDLFADRYGEMGLDRSKLAVSYAMAENVFAITQTPSGTAVRKGTGSAAGYVSCGEVLPTMDVEIRDTDGLPLPDGSLGEIHLRSPCLFDGYFNLPELSAERLKDGWYTTRDLGLRQDNELFVVGRVDDLLIINGRNIVAHEVEDQLNDIPGVARGRILVHAEYDEAAGASKLIVLAEPVGEPDHADLSAAIRDRVFALCGLAPALVRTVPRGFLVKSSAGKLARTQSWEKWQGREAVQVADAPVKTARYV